MTFLSQASVYPENLAASSPDEVVETSFEQYPRVNTIKYAKTASKIVKTKFYVANVVTSPNQQKSFELNDLAVLNLIFNLLFYIQ